MKKLFALFLISVLSASASAANDDAPAPGCAEDDLMIASGASGKGYALIADDILKACGKQVKICQVNSKGGLDNLNLLSENGAHVGIAQIDTVFDMKTGDENIASLQVVSSLNYNYFHVVTLASGVVFTGEKKYMGLAGGEKTLVQIQRFSDLRGKTIAAVGSAILVATKLNRALGYNMTIVEAKSDKEAFDLVRAAKVMAAVTVSSWPSGSIKPLDQSSGLTLVPFDAQALPQYIVRPVNYKNLGVYNNNMMAVPNVLLTRPFNGPNRLQVAALKSCITSKLETMKEGSFQPLWKEVKSLDQTFDLPKFNGGSTVAKKK